MSEPVKIQLNSEEAVRRLIGSDAELEVAIKSRILDALAEHVLKFKLPDLTASFENLEKEVHARLDRAAEEIADKMLTVTADASHSYRRGETVKALNASTKTLIEDQVKRLVVDTINTQFAEYNASIRTAIEDRFTKHRAGFEGFLTAQVRREVAIQVTGSLDLYLRELNRATQFLKQANDAQSLEQLRPLSLGED